MHWCRGQIFLWPPTFSTWKLIVLTVALIAKHRLDAFFVLHTEMLFTRFSKVEYCLGALYFLTLSVRLWMFVLFRRLRHKIYPPASLPNNQLWKGCRGWSDSACRNLVRRTVLRHSRGDRQLLGVPHERGTHRLGGRRSRRSQEAGGKTQNERKVQCFSSPAKPRASNELLHLMLTFSKLSLEVERKTISLRTSCGRGLGTDGDYSNSLRRETDALFVCMFNYGYPFV